MQDILLFGLAAALTPTAILAAVLLLLTPRPRGNGAAYLAGWMLGLFLSALLLFRLGSVPSDVGTVEEEPLLRSGIVLLAGLAMVVGGVLGIRSRRRGRTEPAWLRRVDSFSPSLSLGLGLLLGGLSPKLLLLTGAAVVTVLLAGNERMLDLLWLLVYILIASVPILIPVAFVLVRRDHAIPRLVAWRTWLIDNQGRILGAGSILLGSMLALYALRTASGG